MEPTRATFAGATIALEAGKTLDPDALTGFLNQNGYIPTGTVIEPGEYAKRGGIIDIFPTGAESPLRLDFFGDELDGLRAFDAASQRTIGKLEAALLKPVSEVALSDEAISRFRSAYRVLFAKAGDDDPLYAAVSAGHRHIGMEHWLPLFHEKMETLLDYVPDARMVLGHQAEAALAVLKQHQVLAERTHPLGGFLVRQLGYRRHRVPVTPQHLAGRCPGADPGEPFIGLW